MVARRGAPSLAACFLAVAAMHLLVRAAGLRRTIRFVARVRAAGGAEAESPIIGLTARRVATAAAFYPSRALCLEQSLALLFLLRRRGVPAVLKLGAQPRPFHAHAWVEVAGAAVAERHDLPENLTVFAMREV